MDQDHTDEIVICAQTNVTADASYLISTNSKRKFVDVNLGHKTETSWTAKIEKRITFWNIRLYRLNLYIYLHPYA